MFVGGGVFDTRRTGRDGGSFGVVVVVDVGEGEWEARVGCWVLEFNVFLNIGGAEAVSISTVQEVKFSLWDTAQQVKFNREKGMYCYSPRLFKDSSRTLCR